MNHLKANHLLLIG